MVASTIVLTPVPAPTSALSIAGRAGHAFTPHAMMQGFACHARGVELATAGPARVHARVRSKRVHDVHLRADHGRLVVACSCPARSFGLDVCKHVWAALLEVDRHDALADLRGSRGPLVVEPAPVAAGASTEPAPSAEARTEGKRAANESNAARRAPEDARGAKPANDKAPRGKREAGATAIATATATATATTKPSARGAKALAKTKAAPKDAKVEPAPKKKSTSKAEGQTAAPAKARSAAKRG